jgi:hypothetical protein
MIGRTVAGTATTMLLMNESNMPFAFSTSS